jgi:hypothetical protein
MVSHPETIEYWSCTLTTQDYVIAAKHILIDFINGLGNIARHNYYINPEICFPVTILIPELNLSDGIMYARSHPTPKVVTGIAFWVT